MPPKFHWPESAHPFPALWLSLKGEPGNIPASRFAKSLVLSVMKRQPKIGKRKVSLWKAIKYTLMRLTRNITYDLAILFPSI